MEINYLHRADAFIKSFFNLFELRFKKHYQNAIASCLLGLILILIVFTGYTSRYIMYVGIFLFVYGLMLPFSLLSSRKKNKKMLEQRSEDLKDNMIIYKFEADGLYYKDNLLEYKTNWLLFKGMLIYKDCIYLIPKYEMGFVYYIIRESVGDIVFEDASKSLQLYLKPIDLKAFK